MSALRTLLSISGMSPSRISAPSQSGGNALETRAQRAAQAVARRQDCARCVTSRSLQRLGDTRGFEAGDHDDRVGAAVEAASATRATIAWPSTDLEQLVARRHARGAARRQHDGRDLRSHQRAPLPRCTAVISAMIESGDLGGALRADIEADRRVNALDVELWNARLQQTLDALGMGLLAAPALRHRTHRRQAPRSAPDRRSSGHGSARSAPCGHPRRSSAAPRRAIRRTISRIAEAFFGGEGRARVDDRSPRSRALGPSAPTVAPHARRRR